VSDQAKGVREGQGKGSKPKSKSPGAHPMMTLNHQAKGVVWARAQAQDLWNGEDFVLQIDSHTR
jgi:hypothetical protein